MLERSCGCACSRGRTRRSSVPPAYAICSRWLRFVNADPSLESWTSMAVIDTRGRIGGRVNLVDAVVAVLILVLIPVAFGAYLLFRTPPATLTAINPVKLYQGVNLRIEVQGENLRPFMRVRFNTVQGRSFMIGGT